jgi:hypothetical protein
MRRGWASVLMTAAVAAGLAAVGTATADTHDVLVRITPDSPTGPVRTQNGYTVSITNTTTGDVTFDQVRFLLPGHGTGPLNKEFYGEPRQSSDTSPAFTYVAGSTSGLTTSDPTQSERWLTWDGATVGAGGTATLHFHVTLSDAPAYYWTGATVDAPTASVQGTAKGGQIQVLSSDQFTMTMEASPRIVPLGGTITYTGTLINGTDQTLTVSTVKVSGFHHGRYMPGSTTGILTTEPTPKFNGYIWKQLFEIPAQSQVQFTFDVSADVLGVHRIQSRATLTEPLPDGQSFAGTGPSAPVKVVE